MLLRAVPSARRSAVRLAPQLARRCYHKNIIDHYESPRNVGSLDKNDPDVGTGLVGAPACGDVMKLQFRVGKDGKIEEAVFKASACPQIHCCCCCRARLPAPSTTEMAEKLLLCLRRYHDFKHPCIVPALPRLGMRTSPAPDVLSGPGHVTLWLCLFS